MVDSNIKNGYGMVDIIPAYQMADSNANNEYDTEEAPPAYNMTDYNTFNDRYIKKKISLTNNNSKFYQTHCVPTHSKSNKLFGADAEFIEACARCLSCGLSAIAVICISSMFYYGSKQ